MKRLAAMVVVLLFALGLAVIVGVRSGEAKRNIITAHGEAGCRTKVITAKKKEECLACVKQGVAFHYHPHAVEGKRCHKASDCPFK